MKIYIYSRSKIYAGPVRNSGKEIKALVCRVPEGYSVEGCPEFSSFVYDHTNTLYRLSNRTDRWCILFDIFIPGQDPNRRYHTELYKLLHVALQIPDKTSMLEYRYYFTEQVCTTNRAEQYADYMASCGPGFSTIHNILLPKAIEYYS